MLRAKQAQTRALLRKLSSALASKKRKRACLFASTELPSGAHNLFTAIPRNLFQVGHSKNPNAILLKGGRPRARSTPADDTLESRKGDEEPTCFTINTFLLNSFPALVNGGGWRFQGTRSPSSLGLDDERREERCSLVHTVHCGQLVDAPSIGIA